MKCRLENAATTGGVLGFTVGIALCLAFLRIQAFWWIQGWAAIVVMGTLVAICLFVGAFIAVPIASIGGEKSCVDEEPVSPRIRMRRGLLSLAALAVFMMAYRPTERLIADWGVADPDANFDPGCNQHFCRFRCVGDHTALATIPFAGGTGEPAQPPGPASP